MQANVVVRTQPNKGRKVFAPRDMAAGETAAAAAAAVSAHTQSIVSFRT
jgi:hypothetical protein